MTQSKAIGGMSPHQVRLLAFLRTYIAEKVHAPSYPEMGDELGIKSRSGVARVLGMLEDEGYIRRVSGKIRAIEITAQGMSTKLPESQNGR